MTLSKQTISKQKIHKKQHIRGSTRGSARGSTRGSALGLVLAFIAATCFALIAVLGKMLISKGLSPEQMMGIQMPIAFVSAYVLLFLLPKLWPALTKRPKTLPHNKDTSRGKPEERAPERVPGGGSVMARPMLYRLLAQGVIGSGGTIYFSYKALVYLPASLASLLLFLYPVLVVFLFALTGIKPMAWYNYVVVLAVALGASLALDAFAYVSLEPVLPWQGLLYGLLSALCYALYHAIGEVWLKPLPSRLTTLYTLGFAALVSILILALSTFLSGDSAFYKLIDLSTHDWLLLTLVAIVSNVVPIYLIYRAIQLIGADRVAVLSTLELPITLGLAMLLLGERLQWIQGLGVVIIIAAIFFLHKMEATH